MTLRTLPRCVLWLLLVSSPAFGVEVFSPGPLARAHDHLKGLQQCTQCHEKGQGLSQQKCLACHTELRVAEKKGFHGRMPEAERACQKCHHEHQGLDFKLIQWTPSKEKFDHNQTGFTLKGAHAEVKCEKCHDVRRISSPEVLSLLNDQPGRTTFLGLPNTCDTCHFDEHRGQLGPRCQDCHTEKEWKPAPGFDHQKTDYPLTGKHKKVQCVKCHEVLLDVRTPEDTFPKPVRSNFNAFSEIPHQRCTDCHADPHDNRFGQACESCHTTEGWSTVRNVRKDRDFHQKTRFPLEGLHLQAPCESCHGPFPGQKARFKGLKFTSCTDCHVDAHLGQLKDKLGKTECETCHDVEGFSPARFEREEHARTRYPLEGAHAAVACAECHPEQRDLLKRVPKVVRRRLADQNRPERFSPVVFDLHVDPAVCESCHEDVHLAQFRVGGERRVCTDCHVTESFAKLKFDHDKDSRFPLDGAHEKAACGSCHLTEKRGRFSLVRYRGRPLACDGCHVDVHAGQFASSAGGAASVTPTASVQPARGKRNPVPAPKATGTGTDCATCHTAQVWTPTLFQHEPPFTTYLLEGKHRDAECKSCHPDVQVASGVKVRRYTPVPRECEGCHQDFHKGAFEGFQP